MFSLDHCRLRHMMLRRATIVRRRFCVLSVVVATLSGSMSIAHAVECRSEKGEGSPWAWRQIDGKRCWYRGKAGMDKKLLQWSANSGTPETGTRSAASKTSSTTKGSAGTKTAAAAKNSANKNSSTPARSPSLINGYAEHESLLYTYWPPLVPPADVSNERSEATRAKRM
jgi:hypothetical protein